MSEAALGATWPGGGRERESRHAPADSDPTAPALEREDT
jgi:hypothetical protein